MLFSAYAESCVLGIDYVNSFYKVKALQALMMKIKTSVACMLRRAKNEQSKFKFDALINNNRGHRMGD